MTCRDTAPSRPKESAEAARWQTDFLSACPGMHATLATDISYGPREVGCGTTSTCLEAGLNEGPTHWSSQVGEGLASSWGPRGPRRGSPPGARGPRCPTCVGQVGEGSASSWIPTWRTWAELATHVGQVRQRFGARGAQVRQTEG